MQDITWQIALYMMASGLLGGLLQAVSPNSNWLPWSIPGPVRALLAVLLTATITGLDQASSGRPIGSAMLVAFVTSSPTWGVLIWQAFASMLAMKVQVNRVELLGQRILDESKMAQMDVKSRVEAEAIERGVVGKTNRPPPACVLLFIGAGMAVVVNQGCTGTLEGVRPKVTSVAGVKLATPGSPECVDLSRSEHLWLGTSLATGTLGTAGTLGGIVVLLEQDSEANAAVYVTLIAGGVLDAAAIFAKTVADGYKADWVALGCGVPTP
jgi:hypothetical protein